MTSSKKKKEKYERNFTIRTKTGKTSFWEIFLQSNDLLSFVR
jgi:hypothetical protein